jgi:hypothetical protein
MSKQKVPLIKYGLLEQAIFKEKINLDALLDNLASTKCSPSSVVGLLFAGKQLLFKDFTLIMLL